MTQDTYLEQQRQRWPRFLASLVIILFFGCTPYSTTQIGPPVSSRSSDCEIDVLEAGETPTRPYRDVGVVSLDHCQDYRTPPCREWLRRAACRLGGQVAYLDDYKRPSDPSDNIPANVTFRVLVAAYIADLYGEPNAGSILRSQACSPPCKEGMQCVDGVCGPREENCDQSTDDVEDGGVREPAQKCMD